ncbi:threonine aldolase [Neorhizobium galegae]|uniref:threonine aldolase family protein n=1 Tax=Neorhizobium galegae TaxID=399 RepID=UPI001AE924B3|nr:beta-eliminating lyase-related protein [Neorhizobium galegae]MBP2563168.1 threonine aldolase [Neorhizobium galegae]
MTRYAFPSDNWAPADPAVLDAIAAVDEGFVKPYGQDGETAKLQAVYSDLFERQAFVFPVPTGTAANGLALASITPGYGEIYCHAYSHIVTAEAGAVEFYTGGARLVPIAADRGRIDVGALREVLARKVPRGINAMQPASLCLTVPTENGALYRPEEIAELAAVAHGAGLMVHADGARFASAIAALGCSPADLSHRAGVDTLAFGCMKNGTLGAEAVVTFDPAIASRLAVLHKRAGLLSSKQRYLAAQLIALVANGRWLENARLGNERANRIGDAVAALGDDALLVPVETNQVFCRLPPDIVSRLTRAGLEPSRWSAFGRDAFRLVLSFADSDARVQQFIDLLRGATCAQDT